MKRYLGILGVLIIAATSLTSCRTASPQTGSASQEKYRLGTYSAVFPCSLRMMDKAVRETCQKARLVEISRENTLKSCNYLYKDINDVRLRISLEENKDGTVKIKMKVGPMGDKPSCQALLIELNNNLRAQGSLL